MKYQNNLRRPTQRKALATSVASVILVAGALGGSSAHAATAGFIALEGSDATTFHQDPQYTPQLFKYLQGSSAKDVLVYQPGGGPNPGPTGGVGETVVSSLVGVTLGDYSALYVESGGGCCSADPTALNGFGSAVSSFVAAGGNVSIENYLGGGYDGVVPGGDGAIVGINVSPTGCSDGETVTSAGMAKGFSQPPVDGCWSHQAYDNTYFSKFSYISLMKADPAYGFADGSSFLATGGSLGAPVPEPATWAMMLMGFGLIGAYVRSTRTRVRFNFA
jgi:hypothetical protein